MNSTVLHVETVHRKDSLNRTAGTNLIWALLVFAVFLFPGQGLHAQTQGTGITFTVVTGDIVGAAGEETTDTPTLEMNGTFSGAPAVFSLTGGHSRPGESNTYSFFVAGATFCQITSFTLRKTGIDDWYISRLYLTVGNATNIYFDTVADRWITPTSWYGGAWTGTAAYMSACPFAVTTDPPGLRFTVDGQTYTTGQRFSWLAGSPHTISTTSPQGSGGTRYVFQNWSDGDAISHTVSAPEVGFTFTATFGVQHRLTTAASPSTGGVININPASPDGFYNSGTQVQLTAVPAPGTLFTGWIGDLTGNANPQSVLMVSPLNITALFGTCGYAITPDFRGHGPGAGTGTIAVTAASTCRWTAVSNDAWITVTSGSSGTGSGTVVYSIPANEGEDRSGTITIAGLTFTVSQTGIVTPDITSLNPSQVVAGSPAFNLVVSGSNFVEGAAVLWNGMSRATTFLGVTQLRASIPASDIASAGSVQVVVSNPGGVVSAGRTFTVKSPQNPVPAVSKLSPAGMLKGGPGFSLTVLGTGFVPGSKVRWGSQERATSFESSTILTAVIPGADLAQAGQFAVSVVNPAPGGGASPSMSFGVLAGTVISDISPSAVLPLSGAFKLTIFGENFVGAPPGALKDARLQAPGDGPTVLWNGQPLPTVVVSSTQLQADVPSGMSGSSGAATVTVSGGGSGASNAVPLPVSVTLPAPLLSALTPKSTVPGSARLSLILQGKDFAEGARVLWNGQERQTTFLDSTKLQAIIPEGDLATIGASRVSVLNPSPGGGESNGAMFNCVTTLLYPRLASIPRSAGSAYDDSEFTGIGLTNLGDQNAMLTMTAFDRTGELITGAGITNPALVPIEARHQLAVINWQIFGEALIQNKTLGWFKMESSGSPLMGFFLMFNSDLTKLDGTDVSARTSSSFVAPVIEDQGFTQLHLVNPDVQPADVLFELYRSDGVLRTPGVVRTLPPNAAVLEYVTDLFTGVSATASDYVRIVANRAVSLFEYLGKPGRDVQGLNGQDATGGSTVLYSPQYAVGLDWATRLTVVNLEDRPGVVSLRLVDDTGTQLAAPAPLAIAARGKLQISDQKFFVDASDGRTRSGYVEVRSDGVKLAGSVVFGDPAGVRYTSALPLVSELQTDFVFSQLVSDQTYYTGLAILNPNAQAVTAHIEVYDEKGIPVVEKDEPIVKGGRVTQLLTQYFDVLNGQNRSSGYIRVRTNLGVASYAVFGTKLGTSLSAVPAQAVK